MKKVLVTGSTGFVGRQSLPFLLEMDYEVHAVSSVFPRITQSEVKWHRADLLDQKQIKELLVRGKPTHLLHFAWYAIQGVSFSLTCSDCGYLEREHFAPLKEKCESVGKMLGSMLKHPESFILRL